MPTDAPPDNPALALAVAALTGLRDIRLITPVTARHHGYANGCVCDDCMKRARGEVAKPTLVRQPWEPQKDCASCRSHEHGPKQRL